MRADCFILVAISALVFTFLASSASGQDAAWVVVEGTASMDEMNREEARNRAIEDAMVKAIEEVAGDTISVETLIANFKLSGGIVSAIPCCRVVDKTLIEEKVVKTKKEGQEKPSLTYRVKMKAKVVQEEPAADPSFRIEASLNRSNFKDGDDMQIAIRSTEDCYIAVFTITEDEKILKIIPNRFKKDTFLKANKPFSFPDENDKSKGMQLKVHVPEGKNVVTEAIYVLAFKQPITFDAPRFQEGIYGVYNGQATFMNDLIKEIVGISLRDRAEALMQYQIRKSNGGVQ